MHAICLWGWQLTNGNAEIHEGLCASRNVPIAVAFMVFCILGAATNLYATTTGTHRSSSIASLLARIIAVVILVQLFIAFKCVKERVVIGIVALRLLAGLLSIIFPQFSLSSTPVHQVALTLWIAGTLISLSMFVSALLRTSPR